MKIPKKKFGGRGVRLGCQGGCERRIEVFGKIHTKNRGEGSGVVGLAGGQGGCEHSVGGRSDVGYGGCESRIEGIVQCTNWYCTILKNCGERGGGGNI